VKVLRAGSIVLAQILEAASDGLTNSDVASRLQDELGDMHRGTGHYAQYHDHMGDDESGDVIYSVDGNAVKAPYEMSGGQGKAAKCFIHADKATNVVPRTVYEPEDDQDELDQYANMESAKLYTRGPMPLVERNIPKSERDAAPSGSFAGKGKSFPILKAEDVAAAAHALGRAGSGNYSTDVIKRNIIRIAKAKGWTAQLPKAWQDGESDDKKQESRRTREAGKPKPMKDCEDCNGSGDCPTCDGKGSKGKGDDAEDCKDCDGSGDCDCCDGTGKVPMFGKSKESRHRVADAGLRLVERTAWPSDEILELVESAAGTEIPIKIIAPGKGSSAFYTPESLQRAASDKLFDEAQIYINHATKDQESARPEGDYRDLAGAIKAGSVAWHESHKRGPGLYGIGLFTPQIAPEVRAKAAISGMSIRANGEAEKESSGRPKMREGLPVLERFTGIESVDLVTRAGAGGMVLQESARRAKESSMDAEEKLLLQRLVEKDIRRDAITEGARVLEDVSLSEAAKMYIVEAVIDRGVPKKDGALDTVRLAEAINLEARRFAGAIGAGPRVTGMGAGAPVEISEAERTRRAEAAKAEDEAYLESWATLMDERPDENGKFRIAEAAMRGRVA
jgi:hypothetical protein